MTLSKRIFEFASMSITLATRHVEDRGDGVLVLSKTSPATPSSRRHLDGVPHHTLHLTDMYLTPEAAAYVVTRLRPTSIGPSDPRKTPGPRIDRSCSRLDHRGGIVLDANRESKPSFVDLDGDGLLDLWAARRRRQGKRARAGVACSKIDHETHLCARRAAQSICREKTRFVALATGFATRDVL